MIFSFAPNIIELDSSTNLNLTKELIFMKKLIALALVLVCVLSLGACSLKNDVPTFEDIQDYTEEDFEIYLNRVKRDALIKEWGGPSETSSDNNSDTWVLNEQRTVTIIYDASHRVKDAEVENIE